MRFQHQLKKIVLASWKWSEWSPSCPSNPMAFVDNVVLCASTNRTKICMAGQEVLPHSDCDDEDDDGLTFESWRCPGCCEYRVIYNYNVQKFGYLLLSTPPFTFYK